MRKRKIILTVVLIFLAAGGLYIINLFSGNPVSKILAQKRCLDYFESTYQEDFTVYRSEYNFKIPAYIFEMGPASQPEVRFDTALYSMGLSDEYGGILAAAKLSEDVSLLLAEGDGLRNLEVRAKEDPLTGYGGESPDYFETDPTIRVQKNHYILEVSWSETAADYAGVSDAALELERLIESQLPYVTPNLRVNVEVKTGEDTEPFRMEGYRLLFSTMKIQEQEPETGGILYTDIQYGFTFALPSSWKGYTIVTDLWEGIALTGPQSGALTETGEILQIRHPLWTAQRPRQDIPIMIFTRPQWEALQKEEFSVGAAPFPPSEYGRNMNYVFALPARYNYAFPEGFEEVEDILKGEPLKPIKE